VLTLNGFAVHIPCVQEIYGTGVDVRVAVAEEGVSSVEELVRENTAGQGVVEAV
jgi:hypothetical protein